MGLHACKYANVIITRALFVVSAVVFCVSWAEQQLLKRLNSMQDARNAVQMQLELSVYACFAVSCRYVDL